MQDGAAPQDEPVSTGFWARWERNAPVIGNMAQWASAGLSLLTVIVSSCLLVIAYIGIDEALPLFRNKLLRSENQELKDANQKLRVTNDGLKDANQQLEDASRRLVAHIHLLDCSTRHTGEHGNKIQFPFRFGAGSTLSCQHVGYNRPPEYQRSDSLAVVLDRLIQSEFGDMTGHHEPFRISSHAKYSTKLPATISSFLPIEMSRPS